MKIVPLKTHTITSEDTDIFNILDKYVQKISEKSVLAITSKIVSICEGRIVPIEKASNVSRVSGVSREEEKDALIVEESEYYLPRSINKYNVNITIANGILGASAGIDESNGNGCYILWPKDPQKSANSIREYLGRRFSVRDIGVIITDSKTTPLRWGVTGVSIAHSGFLALNSYIGKKDLFGRPFVYEKVNVADSLSAASVLSMGEGNESTPLAVISDIEHIEFQDRNPNEEELRELHVGLENDMYAPVLAFASWQKGKKS